ncbi:sirohydrochlorin chelatase [Pseudonocardiaceae bacterium YIM PH 21723]|nr:sirohydrochlorin chelatase [Pseudonocardiaceae bacterium YIM PH 21723]
MSRALPPLVAVAHGSRDPRSAASVSALVAGLRRRNPGLTVRLAFLDLCAPRVVDVLRALHGEGHRRVVLVPLLLTHAFHAKVDVPALVAEAAVACPAMEIDIAAVLGPDQALEDLALRRVIEAGARPGDEDLGVVLSAAGSSQASANASVQAVAERMAARTGWRTTAGFACAAQPDITTAIERLRAQGARRIAVASWFLAPGKLPDLVVRKARAVDPDVVIADVLGNDAQLADLIVRRHLAAVDRCTASLPA